MFSLLATISIKPLSKGAKAFEIGTVNALGLAALGVSVELLQAGDALAPAEPWQSMENTGEW